MARTAKRYLNGRKLEYPRLSVYKTAIYARLSVDHDDKKSESIETQVEMLKEFIRHQNENADRNSELVLYDVYTDLGKTGTNFERPGFERLMSDIRAGQINCIIVKDFSRFGRNYIETGDYLEKIFPFLKVRFISVCDHYDSFAKDADSQELSMNIKNLVNDAYAKDISAKCCASKRACQKNGSYVGGMAPYGYHSVNENGIRKLVIDPETAEIVRRIFEQYTDGMPINRIIDGLFENTYYVDNLSIYDENMEIANGVLQNIYRVNAMLREGMTEEQVGEIMAVQITGEAASLGKDQMQNYWYTYIMIFALYMVILLYGQMVATNVATEKSSRAMEVLITSARPTSMMFGKVAASCLAGLIQLLAIFGSAIFFYSLNKEYWGENPIISSIFDMPPELLGYMLIFFVLGFLIYAFLYGAIGSTATKLEDINTSVMPLTFLFIIAFVVVVFSMSSGTVDNTAMRICSYVPFTSPMAMFTRIAMSTVPWYEITISIVILIGSVLGVGVLSAKIYRVGVLLYGTTPRLGSIIKAVWKA